MSGKKNAPATKKRRGDDDDDDDDEDVEDNSGNSNNNNNNKDTTIEALRAQVATLQAQVEQVRNHNTTYYAASNGGQHAGGVSLDGAAHDIPPRGMAAEHVKEMILQQHELDFKPRLSKSSLFSFLF
jgi:hypothetical protein